MIGTTEIMLSELQKIETYKCLGAVGMVSGGGEFKISWALSLLMQNVETENLGILATLLKPVNEFEIDDYFNRVLGELGVERPNNQAAIEGYVKVLAKEVIQGDLDPETSVSMIYAAYVELNYPESLSEFTTLHDKWFCENIIGWSQSQRIKNIFSACKEVFEALEYPNIFNA
jgi:hypothetical protein